MGGSFEQSVSNMRRQFARSTSRKSLKADKGVEMGRSALKKSLKTFVRAKVMNPMAAVFAFKSAGIAQAGKPAIKCSMRPVPCL